MVWIYIHDNVSPFTVFTTEENCLRSRSELYIDLDKICCVFGTVEEKKSLPGEDLFIVDSSIKIMQEGSLIPFPIYSRTYQFRRPGFFKLMKDPNKISDRLKTWKIEEIQKVKRYNSDLVYKTLQILDKIKTTSEYHTSYDLSGELFSLDKTTK